jgi:hypothetical protein
MNLWVMATYTSRTSSYSHPEEGNIAHPYDSALIGTACNDGSAFVKTSDFKRTCFTDKPAKCQVIDEALNRRYDM